ncbi:MAG: YjfB family protein [Defluviitaleaceae bacterium]|nr:YjfB family protein [Defluviitaleaceae bacterium]
MDVMGIANLSMSMAQRNVMEEVGIAVMRNALDQAEQSAQLTTDLMAQVPAPPVGFDGLGVNLDIYM